MSIEWFCNIIDPNLIHLLWNKKRRGKKKIRKLSFIYECLPNCTWYSKYFYSVQNSSWMLSSLPFLTIIFLIKDMKIITGLIMGWNWYCRSWYFTVYIWIAIRSGRLHFCTCEKEGENSYSHANKFYKSTVIKIRIYLQVPNYNYVEKQIRGAHLAKIALLVYELRIILTYKFYFSN